MQPANQQPTILLLLVAVCICLSSACRDDEEVSVSGHVTDPINGGAGVEGFLLVATPVAGGETSAAIRAKTNADGSFVLKGVATSASYSIVGTKQGYAPISATLDETQPSSTPLVFASSPASRIRGEVMDAFDSTPVPNAQVSAKTTSDIMEASQYTDIQVQTGTDGVFFIETILADANYEIVVTKEGFTTASASARSPVAGQTRKIESLAINPLPAVIGKVVNPLTGKPILGCNVALASAETATSADGAFRLERVQLGTHELTIRCEKDEATETVTVVAGSKEANVSAPIGVLSTPNSSTKFWKWNGQRLVPVGARVSLPRSFYSLLEDQHFGNRIVYKHTESRIEASVIKAAKKDASSLEKTDLLLFSARSQRGHKLRAIPLTFFKAGRYQTSEGAQLPAGYYAGKVGIWNQRSEPRAGIVGGPTWKKQNYQVRVSKKINTGTKRLAVAVRSWPAGLYCLAYLPESQGWYGNANGCTLVQFE